MPTKTLKSTDMNYVEISAVLLYGTERAYLVTETGDEEDKQWVPKSQLEGEPEIDKNIITFVIPEWLAIEIPEHAGAP